MLIIKAFKIKLIKKVQDASLIINSPETINPEN
jgi:hypothetical protein